MKSLGVSFKPLAKSQEGRNTFDARIASGVVEIALGLALLTLWRYRAHVGLAAALFFVAIFPGNINQFVNGIDAFGLNTDLARGVRLLLQPVLVLWALWSTGALRLVRRG